MNNIEFHDAATNRHKEMHAENITPQQKRRRLIADCAAQQEYDDNEEMDAIAAILEEVKHEVIPNSNEGLLVVAKTIRHTLIEINELKERNRERRHQELMKLLEKYFKSGESQEQRKADEMQTEVEEQVEFLEDIIQVTDDDVVAAEEHPAVQIAGAQRATLPTTSNVASTEAVRQKHQNEFQAMRERMLEIQRKKMEDRERKRQAQ